ncbi:MAG: hypothetical protein MR531_15940 [Lachnospiraceae bacterium]|nr:hypothetical protein [Lachnospiraceae bacterium]
MGNMKKYWLESITGLNGAHHYGMSSAAGCTKEDLPTNDVPQGSDCFDYTTKTVYFFDGISWN